MPHTENQNHHLFAPTMEAPFNRDAPQAVVETPPPLMVELPSRYSEKTVLAHGSEVKAVIAYDSVREDCVFIKARKGGRGDRRVRRMEREADILAGISHPQIPQLYDADFDAETPYVVMERKTGLKGVQKWLKSHPNPDWSARIIASTLDPLGYLHDRKLVHRDVKPDNMVVSALLRSVALVDLELVVAAANNGTATVHESEVPQTAFQVHSNVTEAGRVIGTADYMAPEQATGSRAGLTADIYALGISYYELLAGDVPFKLKDDHDFSVGVAAHLIATKHVREPLDLTPLEEKRIAGPVLEVIIRATDKDPARRYADAHEMADALAEATAK